MATTYMYGSISSTRSLKQSTFMGLGDSITVDIDTVTGNSYRAFLAADHPNLPQIGGVTKNGYKFEGHSGFTSADILTNISAYYTANPAGLTFLHIGTNDPISPNTLTPTDTANNVHDICTTIRGINANAVIFVAAPIINSTTPYDIYNATYLLQAAAIATAVSGLAYVTLVTMRTDIPASALLDGEHPNDTTGYPTYFYPPIHAALLAGGY